MSTSAPTGVSAPRGNISGYNLKNIPNMTPEQMGILGKLLGGLSGGGGIEGGLGYLSKLAGGGDEAFRDIEAPAYRAFNSQIGQIGSRFAGGGAIGSSAFQNATSGAAADFGERLGAQRMGIQQNAIDKLLGLSERVLNQKPYDTFAEKKDQGFDWAGLLGQLGGAAIGSVGGPIGSGIGSALLPKILKALGIG